MKSLSLNQNRIDLLVEQLYDINKRLVQNEGRLLRLAESYGVKRDSFLEQYHGAELDPNWMKSIANLAGRGWKEFAKSENQTIRDIRQEIQNLATETGISIGETPCLIRICASRCIFHSCLRLQQADFVYESIKNCLP